MPRVESPNIAKVDGSGTAAVGDEIENETDVVSNEPQRSTTFNPTEWVPAVNP